MSGHGFTSAFAPDLEAYLEFKKDMGFCGISRIWYRLLGLTKSSA